MEASINNNENYLLQIEDLIQNNELATAEKLFPFITDHNAHYHYLYGKLLLAKSWFDSAKSQFELAALMCPENSFYKDEYIKFMGRHRHYEDDYYRRGYHRNRGCSCCLCDDCCCDPHISCCDLICLDQCCECMGGDLIDCI